MRMIDHWGRVSLAEVDQRAPLLDRRENKYVIDPGTLDAALAAMDGGFDVLEIDGLTGFSYETIYFDSRSLAAYRAHVRGRRLLVKARSRCYLDSGLAFVEVKVKAPGGRTVKRRLAVERGRHGRLDEVTRDFVHRSVRDAYGRDLAVHLGPALAMTFVRTTLVGRGAPERVTIDRRLRFVDAEGSQAAAPGDRIIVEVKSERGRGVADRALRSAGARPGRCSKYCIGLNLVRDGLPNNEIIPVLETFGWTGRGALPTH